MIFSNLIGFGMGYQILLILIPKVLTPQGLVSVFNTLVNLTFLTLGMFWIREGENEVMKGL